MIVWLTICLIWNSETCHWSEEKGRMRRCLRKGKAFMGKCSSFPAWGKCCQKRYVYSFFSTLCDCVWCVCLAVIMVYVMESESLSLRRASASLVLFFPQSSLECEVFTFRVVNAALRSLRSFNMQLCKQLRKHFANGFPWRWAKVLGGALLICAVVTLRRLTFCSCPAVELAHPRFVHLGVLLLRCMVTFVNLEIKVIKHVSVESWCNEITLRCFLFFKFRGVQNL